MATRIHVGTRERLTRDGGLHNYIRALAAGQRELGDEVVVLDRVTGRGGFDIATGRPELLEAAGNAGSTVHLHFAHSALPLLRKSPWVGRANCRVLHFHGPWFAEGRVQGNSLPVVVAKWLTEVVTYWSADLRYIAASDAFAGVLHRRFAVPRGRIRVVHPGVDVTRFQPGDGAEARARLGLPATGPLFVAVRRLEHRMGLDVALRALRAVPDAHLAICGTGTLADRLRMHAEELGVAGRVTFLGRVSDYALPAVYQAADFSLVPTATLEGFGLVVLESFACGTPVISTGSGGLVEAQGPFADEWTVTPGSSSELASRMNAAISDIGTAGGAAARSARRAYAEMCSVVEMARRVDGVLADGSVVSGPKP